MFVSGIYIPFNYIQKKKYNIKKGNCNQLLKLKYHITSALNSFQLTSVWLIFFEEIKHVT